MPIRRAKPFFNHRSVALNALIFLLVFSLLTLALFFTGGALALPLIGGLLLSFATPIPSILAAALLTGLTFIVTKVAQAILSRVKKLRDNPKKQAHHPEHSDKPPAVSESFLAMLKMRRRPNPTIGQTHQVTLPFYLPAVQEDPLECIRGLRKAGQN